MQPPNSASTTGPGTSAAGRRGNARFLVLPETFKREVCAGFDARAAIRVLVANGWIAAGGDGRPTQKPRLPGIGTATRVHVFTSKVWESDE